jgi:hypothetical protein
MPYKGIKRNYSGTKKEKQGDCHAQRWNKKNEQ